MEAVYLAKQAGYEVALIDKDSSVPARALADHFYHLDLLGMRQSVMGGLLREFDLILPATENPETLARLNKVAEHNLIPLALDLPAYSISSSKLKSNFLFALAGIAMPENWPACGFPVIAKPSGLSGSAGVKKIDNMASLTRLLNVMDKDVVIQKYLKGPSYSLEVMAHRGEAVGLQVTKLEFDAGFDCKRVLAGPDIDRNVAGAFYSLGERLAVALNLSGIMDIEVIDDDGELKVLEIDARLPSQTPSAVYHSTGINMVKLLAEYWIEGKLPEPAGDPEVKQAVIYEHLKFSRGVLEVAGEHILTGARGLKIYRDKFSAEVLITNFEESPMDWVATAIYTGKTEAQVWETRNRAVLTLQQAFEAVLYIDPYPYYERTDGANQAVL